jgi:hypothetical protein
MDDDDKKVYIITIKDDPEQGAYSVETDDGEIVLFLFEEYDDADRFSMMLADSDDDNEYDTEVTDVDLHGIKAACQLYGYDFIVFTSNDLVTPRKNNKFI